MSRSMTKRRQDMRARVVWGFLILMAPNFAAQAAVRVSVDARTLRVAGTDGPDSIVAEVTDNPASIAVDGGTAGETERSQRQSFPLEAFDRLEVSAGDGEDFVNIIDPAGLLDARRKVLKLDGGNGNNIVILSY